MASPMRKSRAWLALLVGCCTVHSGLFVLPAAAPPRPATRPAQGPTYAALTAGTYPGALAMRKSRIAGRPNKTPATARGVGRTLKIMLGVPSLLAVFSFLMVLRGYKTMETNGDAMQEKWSSFARKPGQRMLSLMAGAVRVGLIALRAKLIRDPEKKSAMHSKAGKRAVTELVRLGPTYVKLGQILSCREDLVPKEYINELKRLQDEVPAFSGERAKKIIETELGKPASELFAEFDDKPLAAASLGQVHRAKTKDGVEMAIKIQRDNLKEMYDLDLAQFDKIAVTLDKFKIGVEGASGVWVDMFEDAKVILYREIDYRAEAENTQRWYDNFKDLKWTTSPKVINEFTTSKVLALTFVKGTKISDLKALEAQNFDRTLLAKNLARAYLLAFCKYGFFNTDPHPGNLAVDDGYPGGRLIFYDFGQACELSDKQADGILQVIQSIVDFEAEACVKAMKNLGCLKEGSDFKKVEAVVQNNFETGKVKSKRSKRKRALTEEEKNQKTPKQTEVMKYFKLPPALAFVARAITQMEGVGVMLDEEYEFIDFVADKVPELQVERGAGISYIAGQLFKNWIRS
ncbi:unnamed protein product [Cladocopium goreaui]|uniref:ABC1 atypical kinase-like domain-containing protein n=1 Tax=Cladocopium goreaui TaxID=2562237 RepID=A0A9P1CNU8_9DINO|nr:unnamed protein product [Cladocopium goreaui]